MVMYSKGSDFITLKLIEDGEETWVEVASEVDSGSIASLHFSTSLIFLDNSSRLYGLSINSRIPIPRAFFIVALSM